MLKKKWIRPEIKEIKENELKTVISINACSNNSGCIFNKATRIRL